MSGIKDISTSKQTAKRKRETPEKKEKALEKLFFKSRSEKCEKKASGPKQKKPQGIKEKKIPGPEK